MRKQYKEHVFVELRIITARGAAATALMAGVLLVGVIAAHPVQALAAQKTSVAATSAVSAKLASAASSVETAGSSSANSIGKTAAAATSGVKALSKSAHDAQPPITRKKARKIALNDACFKKKQVKKLMVKNGKRSGQDAFVVTFRFKKMHYSYAVAKWGGDILSRSAHMGKAGKSLVT